jgi:hypothetical protein
VRVRWPSLPASARAERAVAAEAARRDALHLLAGEEGLCGVCRERDDAAGRWLASFVGESRHDAGVRTRLRAAAGFCPAHTRHLLAEVSASWLVPSVHAEALAGGLRLLDADAVGRNGQRLGPCPACAIGEAAAERALTVVLRALEETPVRQAVDGGALCLPHTATLATRATVPLGLSVAATASARLTGEARETVPVAWLAGLDPDAPARARQQERLDPLLETEESAQRHAVAERWEADVALACCPLCLAGHRAARRLLRWAATTTGTGHPTREETRLCPRHLHDLAALAGPGRNAAALLADNADAWRDTLTGFRKRTAGGRRERGTAAAYLLTPSRCRACEAEDTAHTRQAALLAAALRDPVHARAYEQAHGVCLRHVLTWDGPPPALVGTVLRARLAWLGWELAEVRRKQDWHTRHEIKGAEMTIGPRAPTLLDGRVYAGLPAPRRPPPPTAAEETEK